MEEIQRSQEEKERRVHPVPIQKDNFITINVIPIDQGPEEEEKIKTIQINQNRVPAPRSIEQGMEPTFLVWTRATRIVFCIAVILSMGFAALVFYGYSLLPRVPTGLGISIAISMIVLAGIFKFMSKYITRKPMTFKDLENDRMEV